MGVIVGLVYFYQEICGDLIVYCDLKVVNVLLDLDMEFKFVNYGVVSLFKCCSSGDFIVIVWVGFFGYVFFGDYLLKLCFMKIVCNIV